MGPRPYKEQGRMGAKGRQKSIQGGAKTALKAAPKGRPVLVAPKGRSMVHNNGVQKGAKGVFKGRQRVFKGRQKSAQWSAKMVFKGAQRGCSKR